MSRPCASAPPRAQRRTPARLVLGRPGRLPAGPDRGGRLHRRPGARHRLHRRLRPDVRGREPRRLRRRRPGGPYRPANRITDYRGLYRQRPARRARPGLLPALPGRSAARHHRPVRQGHGLLRGRRRGPGLARGDHGRQRRDRALLLPPVDGGALPRTREPGRRPRPPRPRGRAGRPAAGIPAPLAAAIALAAVLGIALSGAPQLVLRFASGALLYGEWPAHGPSPAAPAGAPAAGSTRTASRPTGAGARRPTARAQGNQARSPRVDQ